MKRFYYESHDQRRTHLADLMAAYNFARRLKMLGRLTPYGYRGVVREADTSYWATERQFGVENVDAVVQAHTARAIRFGQVGLWQHQRHINPRMRVSRRGCN